MPHPPASFSYGILLYPGFELLDIAGPLEILNMLAQYPGHEGMALSIVSRTLDPVAPSLPSHKGAKFQSRQRWVPTHTFEDAPRLDVLVVPGGVGSVPPAEFGDEAEFVGRVYRDGLEYLFTVCSGAAVAARAGVLDGHRATTNKSMWKALTAVGPRTHWVGRARWVVSGNIWTTSGVSAGTDGMIAWVEHLFPADLVEDLVNAIEYTREKDPRNDPFAEMYGVEDVPPCS